MQLLLTVISGTQPQAKISLRDGQMLQIGRTEWADCAFPDDVQMSGIHFSVECGKAACVIRDLKSTNGTFVNGKKKREAVLASGDEVRAGNTVFSVTIEGAPATPHLGIVEGTAASLKTLADVDANVLREQFSAGMSSGVDSPPVTEPATLPPLAEPVPRGPASRLVLVTLTGAREGQKLLLRAGQTATVGRTERADMAIPYDHLLSTLHFSLDWQAGSFRLRDLQSTNGTTLNDRLIAEAILEDGDRIRAGRTQFEVHIEFEASSQDAAVRRTAITSIPLIVDDTDPDVQRIALWSAAWAKQGWVLDYCRRLCDDPKPKYLDALYLLGVLGRPLDLRSIKAIGSNSTLGPDRFQAIGAFGHPDTVELLLEAIGGEDPAESASAGAAFERITGVQLNWNTNGAGPSEENAERTVAETPGEIPDVKQAMGDWEKLKPNFAGSTRVCRGFDLSHGCEETVLAQLDMQSRYEAMLRRRVEGKLDRSLTDVERFPLVR